VAGARDIRWAVAIGRSEEEVTKGVCVRRWLGGGAARRQEPPPGAEAETEGRRRKKTAAAMG